MVLFFKENFKCFFTNNVLAAYAQLADKASSYKYSELISFKFSCFR